MGRQGVKSEYEEVRKARIFENQARLASLGLQKTIAELRTITSKPQAEKKKHNKADYFSTPLRRSNRMKDNSAPPSKGRMKDLSPEALARRCTRLKVVLPCHICGRKEFCGEEDCKRRGALDMDSPCLGKTDCSICHSSYGVLCRGCLKGRYGEELEEVRANKGWVCPHCTEEKGINPYWICNSKYCLKKRKMARTFRNAILRGRKMGYKSVAHLLMDQLQQA
ncbi:uncharacterized protein LOC132055574 [Lycium ferocissimum]|uniref:uncharacterized protein LOC132055574 n=1 Tax=Lycium ferocissimum TaxID=112874 RepID=UPI002815BB88|nr:uncharacterized protein LOC132055574 [Lycium ferocissimum]